MRLAVLFELGPWAAGLAVSLLWIGSCVAVPLAAAFRVARGGSARARYWIALIAFAAAAIVPVLAVLPEAPEGAWLGRSGWSPSSPGEGGWEGAGEEGRGDEGLGRGKLQAEVKGSALAAASESSLAPLIPVLWLSVGLVLLAREGAGHVVLSRRRRHWVAVAKERRRELAWPDDVPLFSAAEGPSTLGLWKPVVALPLDWLATLPPEAAVCVARHELAHARRRDPLINALVRVVRAALWPAAPLWLLERMIHTEREAAADAAAVGSLDGDRVADYASGRARRVAVAFGQGSRLEDRLGRLFGARHVPRLRFAAAAAMVAAGVLTAAAVPPAPLPSWTPRPMSVAATASPKVRAATAALNEILLSTRFHDHALNPAVKAALARFTAAGTPGPLLEMLQARDARVRECAAWIAGELGDPRAAAGLAAALADRDLHVRQTAAWALARLGG